MPAFSASLFSVCFKLDLILRIRNASSFCVCAVIVLYSETKVRVTINAPVSFCFECGKLVLSGLGHTNFLC